MTIIKDTYQSLYGHRDINYAGVTTGKSVHRHGIRGRGIHWPRYLLCGQANSQ